VRGSLSVARTLLRRRTRRALARPKRTALTVVLFLFPVVSLLLPAGAGGVGATIDGGTVVADGESIGLVPLFEAGFSAFWLLTFVAAVFKAEDDVTALEAGGLLVRAGGVAAAVRGRELAGHARRLALFGIWFVVGVGALAVGGGGLAVLPIGAVGFLLLLLSASTTGRAVGLFVRRILLDRGYSVERAKVVAAAALLAGTIVASSRSDWLLAAVRGLPTAWFAEWLLFELTDWVRPRRLLGSLLLGVGLTVVGSRAHERLAADVWFRNPGNADESGASSGPTRLRALVRPVVDGPTGALAWSVTLRRLRSPGYVAAVVLLGLLFWQDATGGFQPTIRPMFAAAYLAAALPAVVALNPLADEGPVLPMLLRSGLSGRGFVAGYALAAAGLAGVLAAVVTAAVVAFTGTAGVPTVVVVVATPLLAFEVGCVAVAIGTVVPNADAAGVVDSEGVTFPSSYAIAAYLPAVAVVLAPMLAATVLVGTPTALLAGTVGSLLLGGVGAAAAVRLAAPRFAEFALT